MIELEELIEERQRVGPGVLAWTLAMLLAGPPRGREEVRMLEEAREARRMAAFREERRKLKRLARDRARRARLAKEAKLAPS